MCVDERDARDRVQLARALMEHELDVRERLEPCAEVRLRLAHSFGDGADAAAIERVEVEDAVGLAEPERPEHHRFRLVRPAHAASVGSHPAFVALSRKVGDSDGLGNVQVV